MTTTDSTVTTGTEGRWARLSGRLAPAARQARTIAWLLVAGMTGFLAGGLVVYTVTFSGVLAGVLMRLSAADAAFAVFAAVASLPAAWRWYRSRSVA